MLLMSEPWLLLCPGHLALGSLFKHVRSYMSSQAYHHTSKEGSGSTIEQSNVWM